MDAAALLAKAKRRFQSVDLPIGETVLVRSLGAAEMSALHTALKREDGEERDYAETAALQIAAFLSDERGEAIFTLEQAQEFISRDVSVVKPIVAAGMRLNGLSQEAVEEAQGN